MQYRQLSSEERYVIEILLQEGESITQISRILKRNKSTISREIRRNKPSNAALYLGNAAELLSRIRSRKANSRAWRMTSEMQSKIIHYLKEEWSPEQIKGRMDKEGTPMVSIETIYSFVYSYKDEDLSQYLRQKKRKRQKRSNKKARRGIIKNRVSIDERPEIVDLKSRFGDFEADTIVGKGHKSYLLTITERMSNYNLIAYLPNKDSTNLAKKMEELLEPFKGLVKTITVDNGKEFAGHEKISNKIAQVYFAHPYSSYERGCNENQNGLIRQYVSKGSCFRKLTSREIQNIQETLNNRPRKKLNFETPQEFVNKIFKSVALQI